MPMRFSLLPAGAALMLAGCTPAYVPLELREVPEPDLTVAQVRGEIDRYEGTRVRWGGTIASVENREDETWVEIVATRLDGSGRPRITDYTYGRFLARIDGFLDPQIYAAQREITVFGEVERPVERPIGEHPYSYPLVRVETYQLWSEYPERRYGHYPHPYYYYPPYPYSYRFYRPYWYW